MEEEVIQHENSLPLNSSMIWIHVKMFYCWQKNKDEAGGKNVLPGETQAHKVQPQSCAQMWRLHNLIIVCLFTRNSLPGFCLRLLPYVVTRVLAMCVETIHISVRVSAESHSSLLRPHSLCYSSFAFSLAVCGSLLFGATFRLQTQPVAKCSHLINLLIMLQMTCRNFSLNSGRWAAELLRAE